MRTAAKEKFGPFVDVESALIHPTGFACCKCRHQVRRLGVVCPATIPRMMFYACKCGTVAVWEDERQPRDAKQWSRNIKLLKKAGTDVVIFNGNKPTPSSFPGIN